MVGTFGGQTYGGGTYGGGAGTLNVIETESIVRVFTLDITRRVFSLETIIMIDPFKIAVNDLQPVYKVQAKNNDDTVIDITGAAIYMTLKNSKDSTLKVNRNSDKIEITDASNGLFQYNWEADNVDTAGIYYIEFEIDPSSGGKFTLPQPLQGRAEVHIISSLDTV